VQTIALAALVVVWSPCTADPQIEEQH